MPTLVIVRRPRTARSVTQTVRMRFLVGTSQVPSDIPVFVVAPCTYRPHSAVNTRVPRRPPRQHRGDVLWSWECAQGGALSPTAPDLQIANRVSRSPSRSPEPAPPLYRLQHQKTSLAGSATGARGSAGKWPDFQTEAPPYWCPDRWRQRRSWREPRRSPRIGVVARFEIALGKSQAACAALLGVSPESYRTWDAGRRS